MLYTGNDQRRYLLCGKEKGGIKVILTWHTAAVLVFKNLIAVMVTGVVTISILRHFIFI